MERWMETALEHGMGAMTKQAARWVMAPRSFRRLAPTFGWLGPLAMTRPAHSFASQVRAILATDDSLADELGTIDVPTLVIVGNQDILTPRGDSEEIAERIPGAELVVISGAAHGMMVEHASTFNTILFDFLRRASKIRSAAASA
jgi:3-oxoadipate enol-lactonase